MNGYISSETAAGSMLLFRQNTQKNPPGKFTSRDRLPKRIDNENAAVVETFTKANKAIIAPSLIPHPPIEIGISMARITGGTNNKH